MACWICPECRYKNCDVDECQNPKCPTRQKPTFPDKKPEFVEIDAFPAKGETFSKFIDSVTKKVVTAFALPTRRKA